MTFNQLQELNWDWLQHRSGLLDYPRIIIMSMKDYYELAESCGRVGVEMDLLAYPNKVTGLDIAIWKDETKEPLIL
jgi:hypothetical protein